MARNGKVLFMVRILELVLEYLALIFLFLGILASLFRYIPSVMYYFGLYETNCMDVLNFIIMYSIPFVLLIADRRIFLQFRYFTVEWWLLCIIATIAFVI